MLSRNTSYQSLPEAQCAWLAGLIEGEGCISLITSRSGATAPYWTFRLVMTDEDVVRRAYEVAGVGQFSQWKVAAQQEHHKPQWLWTVRKQPDLKALLEDLLPWFGERRSLRAIEAIQHIESRMVPVDF